MRLEEVVLGVVVLGLIGCGEGTAMPGAQGTGDTTGVGGTGAGVTGGAPGTMAPGSGGTTSGVGGPANTGGATLEPTEMPGTTGNLIALTHADGWIEPDLAAPVTVVGAWFDYKFPEGVECDGKLTKAAQNGGDICFSASACTGGSAALGMNLCNLSNLGVSTWPEMQLFIEENGLDNGEDAVFAFGQCNPGRKLATLTWAQAMPAGTVSFRDATDAALGTAPIADGATSVAVPVGIDGGLVAAVHFVFNGTAVPSYDFCLGSVTLSYL